MSLSGLAYCVIGSTDPDRWVAFAETIAGFEAKRTETGCVLRMDERAGRLFVTRHAADRYLASGWELADRNAFDAAIATLRGQGVELTASTQAERDLRKVAGMMWFKDPAGNRHELVHGPALAATPFRSPQSVDRFVTGELGLGHVVLPAPALTQTRDFLIGRLGFGLSDFMIHRPAGPSGPAMRIDFLHCANPRHHSLALFEGEVPTGCVHLMVEVATLDDVGRAYDRMKGAGGRLMATLGRHSNDRMVSFYVATPGGFALEYGYGGLQLDWAAHHACEFTTVSEWGHDFSVGFGSDERARLAAVA